ncbi:MAG: VWA domain-containing protein [Planctomycetes bacterium]|nr:VWA domain-containing protein [Planctomycetota bacterium]
MLFEHDARGELRGGDTRGSRRRGAVAAQVAISMTVLLGFAALVVDMGMLYNTRTELQRAADSAALAAANRLGAFVEGASLGAARLAAQEAATENRVLGAPVELSDSDVEFGRAALNDQTGKYSFTPTEQFPNAVRVHVRRSSGSKSGAVPLMFANIFGIREASLGAKAAAVLTPRDVTFVLDLSSSHNDDSSLRSYKKTEIDNHEVWEHLKDPAALAAKTDSMGFKSEVSIASNGDGTSKVNIKLTSDASSSTKPLGHVVFGLDSAAQAAAQATAASGGGYPVSIGTDPKTGVSGIKFDGTTLGEDGQVQTESFSFSIPDEYLKQMTVATKAGTGVDKSVQYNLAPGPVLGNMNVWGTQTTGPGWDFAKDSGLVRLPKGSKWSLSSAYVSQTLQLKGYGTYNAAEMAVINSSTYDRSTTQYYLRLRVALGLDRWKSGKSGGQAGGDGDNKIEANELVPLVPYPSAASNPDSTSKEVGGNWNSYFAYVISTSASMNRYNPSTDYYGDPGLRYRFGLKTWVDYLQEEQEGTAASPGLDGAPTQPMGAVIDGVNAALDIIQELQSDDQVGMAGYGTVGYGPAEKPDNMSWLIPDADVIRDRVNDLQAGMWTSNTNIAQGIDRGVDVLFQSPEARGNAAKVMLLLTDGLANQTRPNPTQTNVSKAKTDTVQAATDARARGVQIYTVSVGVNSDTDLMEQIAQIGGGEHFHAEGDIEAYKSQLRDIFQKLGGKRPVILFE